MLERHCGSKTENNEGVWGDDVFDRQKEAEFLTALLEKDKRGMVINLDAGWGFGKTFFLERWQTDLIDRGYKCFYFNAWEEDYCKDPLIPFILSIEDQIAKDRTINEEVLEKLKRTIGKMSNIGVGIGINYLPLLPLALDSEGGVFGIKMKIILDLIKKMWHAIKNSKSAYEVQMEKMTVSLKEQKILMGRFKDEFNELVEDLLKNKANQQKLFVFIDELDRCRPIYAISMLEKIKHLMNIEKTVFVIATNTQQMNKSIESVYGVNFDSSMYLKRFFDQTYLLKEPDYKKFAAKLFIDSKIICEKNQEIFNLDLSMDDFFAEMARLFGLSLRDQQQCYVRLRVSISASSTVTIFHFPYLSFLVMSQFKNLSLYGEYINGRKNGSQFFSEVIATVKKNLKNTDYLSIAKCYFSDTEEIDAMKQEINRLHVIASGGKQLASSESYKVDILEKICENFDEFKKNMVMLELAANLR